MSSENVEPWPSKSTTAMQIANGVDLTGKFAVVTGANTGIGLETARALAHSGAHVIMACRNLVAANEAKDRIAQDKFEKGEMKVSIMKLDCSSLASVEKFVREYKRTGWPLHLLILNAGIYSTPGDRITEDGFEITFQAMFSVNHLSQFHLAMEMRELLIASAPARIVIVSSDAHQSTFLLNRHLRWTPADITAEILSPSKEKMSGDMNAYCVSKLCNVLNALLLNKELEEKGVVAFSLHPGFVKTDVARSMGAVSQAVVRFLHNLTAKNCETGASTTVLCAVGSRPPIADGHYFSDNHPVPASAAGQSLENAEKLKEVSLQMIADWRARQ